jgi:hypothetical protein
MCFSSVLFFFPKKDHLCPLQIIHNPLVDGFMLGNFNGVLLLYEEIQRPASGAALPTLIV